MKELNEKQLNNIVGGFDFCVYDTVIDENTLVEDLVSKYPWILTIYPQLQIAASLKLTIKSSCRMVNLSYEQLQQKIDEICNKYNPDGSLKVEEYNK